MAYIVVFLGGGLGAALRHGINIAVARMLGAGFPYATFFINVTGSFVMGLIAAWFAFKGDASQHWRLFLTTGFLGGYTSFSTFSHNATQHKEHRQHTLAAGYVFGSGVLGIVGLFAGLA